MFGFAEIDLALLLGSFHVRRNRALQTCEFGIFALFFFFRASGNRSPALRDDVAGVLKADDYLDRGYRADGRTINLFIAYYATQRAGESMHSPKNCLPGSGWVSVVNDTVVLRNDGDGGPQKVNRYLIEKNGERALVIYWYQAGGRVIASEYAGKVFLVWDALRTGRRDAALVRLIVPLRKAEDPTKPLDALLSFAQASRSQLPKFLPD